MLVCQKVKENLLNNHMNHAQKPCFNSFFMFFLHLHLTLRERSTANSVLPTVPRGVVPKKLRSQYGTSETSRSIHLRYVWVGYLSPC